MKYFVLFLCICFSSCSSLSRDKCNENIRFRKVFFEKVIFIEKYVLRQEEARNYANSADFNWDKLSNDFKGGRENFLKFKKALFFLGQHVTISSLIFGYSIQYPSAEIFFQDKEKWLKWYEENKCKNIH